jgi:outer membrane autotransporter protein
MLAKLRRGGRIRLAKNMSVRGRLLLLATITGITPVAAADITITGSQTYDPLTMAGQGLIVDGAAAELSIGAGDTVTTLVDLRNGGTVDNVGAIVRTGASDRGVVGGIGTVINRDGGQITSSDETGVLLFEGGSVDNGGEGSLIRGGLRGVSIQGGEDAIGTINNHDGAVIESTGEIGVYINANVTLTNGVGSTIRGGGSGIRAFGELTVDNKGTIEGLDGDGISLGDGTVTNSGNGALIRAVDTGVFVDGEGWVINEDGAAIDAENDGVVMNWGGDVTNRGGATIDSGNVGVTIADFGTLTNSGAGTRITATGGDAGVLMINYDIDIDEAHILINQDGASIAGGRAGVEFTVDAGGSVSNTGGATISGEKYGIHANGDRVTVTNSGEGSRIETTDASYDSRFTVSLAGGGEVINTDGAKIVGASSENGIGVYFFDPNYDADVVPTLSGSVVNGVGSSITGSATAIHSLINTSVDNAGMLDGRVWLLDTAVNDVTLHTGSTITGELFIGHNALSSLTLTGAGEQLYSEAVNGPTSFTANLVKKGTGSWLLDRDLETTTVSVDEGTLIIGVDQEGSLKGDVTVASGAAVGGSGLIHGDLVNDGVVAPGNSPGVLTVKGDYLQKADAVLKIELDPLSALSDRLDVVADNGLHGTATLNAGSVLDVTSLSSTYTLGTRYTVLSTENGLFGENSDPAEFVLTGDLTPSAFLTLEDEYDAYNAYIAVRQSQTLESAAIGGNQGAVATALDALAEADPLRNLALNAPDAAFAQAMFDGLSGEIHSDIKGALVEDSRFVRDAANRRIRSAFDGIARASSATASYDANGLHAAPANSDGIVLWGEALAMTADADGVGSLADFDRTSAGFVAGVDAPVGDWRVGFLGGYSHSSYHVDDRASSGSSDTYDLGVYAGTQFGALGFRTGAMYAWHDIDTHRGVVFPDFTEPLSADYNAATAQVFGELGYRFDWGRSSIEPFVNLAYVHLNTDGFTETGGALAALASEKTTTENTFSTFGARAATAFELGSSKAALHGMLGWQHAYDDVTPISAFAFGGGSSFDIAGVPIARDALAVEAGLDFWLTPNATLGSFYSGQIASDAQAHAVKVRFDLKL